MSQLPGRVEELDRSGPVYLVCVSGNRSAAMTDFLRYAGFDATRWPVAPAAGRGPDDPSSSPDTPRT